VPNTQLVTVRSNKHHHLSLKVHLKTRIQRPIMNQLYVSVDNVDGSRSVFRAPQKGELWQIFVEIFSTSKPFKPARR
jgi:hypothetical protein